MLKPITVVTHTSAQQSAIFHIITPLIDNIKSVKVADGTFTILPDNMNCYSKLFNRFMRLYKKEKDYEM